MNDNKNDKESIKKDLIKSTVLFDNQNSDFRETVAKFNKKGFIISRTTRYIIFFFILLSYLITSMDHGTIPAATTQIKKDLKIDDAILGIFGSLVYFGNILGALIFMSFIREFNRKLVIILSLIMILIFIYLFAVVENVYFILFSRTITGIFQSFLAIYFPVWCDQFGTYKSKSTMIAVLQLCVPLGVVLGYILTSTVKTWYYSLYIQCALTGCMIIIFIFIPSIYFSTTIQRDRSSSIDRDNPHSELLSLYKDSSSNDIKLNIFDDLKILLRNYIFLTSAMALAILYFIITAIQFWGSDYLKTVLYTPDNQISIAFSFTCISAPTLGIILGGITLDKVGGPETFKSIIIGLFYSLAALVCALPIPIANNVFYFTGILWLVLFFGGAMVPILTGIIITCVPHNLRSSSNSLSNFMSNLIGYLPAPFVYGIISKYTSIDYPKLAMMITLYTSFLGVVFISAGVYFKYKKNKLTKSSRKSIVKSDLSTHPNLIANLWGNKIIENEDKLIDEVKTDEDNLMDNTSFYLDNNEIGLIGDKIQNKEKQTNNDLNDKVI